MLRSIILLSVSLMFLSRVSIAQSTKKEQGNIAGTVHAASGTGLSSASIKIKGTTFGTITDANGAYVLKSIPAGTYTLHVTFSGFTSKEVSVVVKPGQTVSVDVALDEATVEIDAVEVIGKTVTQEIREQAYHVTAIDTKALQNSSLDAKDILNRAAGIRVMEDGGLGSNLRFSLNGFTGDQVKFFLDGIPMDNFGSSINISNIPVNMIERIEIYKGVVPVWLGTDALGGAVNIITNKKNKFLDASYSFGSFNTHRVSLNGAYTNYTTGFTVRANGSYNYSDNNYKVWVPIVEGNTVVGNANVRRFHDQYNSATLQVETGVVDKKYADNLLFGIIATTNDKEVQTGATMGTVYGGITTNSHAIIPTLKYNKDDLFIKGLNVSFYGAFNSAPNEVVDTLRGVRFNWRGEREVIEGSDDGEISRTFTVMKNREVTTQFNTGYKISDKHSIAFNYSLAYLRRETSDSENPDKVANRYPNSLTKHIAGLAYRFDANEKWNTTVFGKFFAMKAGTTKQFDFGLETERIEPIETTKTSFGYGIATSYHILPTLQAKASYEHTLRLPSASEIFGDGLFILPNPDLGPEQSNNINVGLLYGVNLDKDNHVTIEANAIYRNSTDLIYQVVSVASPQTNYDNLSDTRTIGGEGSIRYTWKNMLNLGVSATYQNITDQADFIYNNSYTGTGYQKNYQKGFRVPNIPFLFGNASAGVTFRNVGLSESILHVNYFFNYSQRYFLTWAELGSKDTQKVIPGQTSHNLEVSYSLAQGKYNVALECRNLTDEKLYDRYYLQKPGRAFYLKLRYSFGK